MLQNFQTEKNKMNQTLVNQIFQTANNSFMIKAI